MDKSMEEINDALIASIILKVFAQSAFKDSLWKKKIKPTTKKTRNIPQIEVLFKKIISYLFNVYLQRYSPTPYYLPSPQIVPNLEKAI